MKNNIIKKNSLFFFIIFTFIASASYFNINFSISNDYPLNDEGGFAFPIWSIIFMEKLYIFGNNAAWSIPQTILGYLVSKIFGFSFLNLRYLSIGISTLCFIFVYFYLNKLNKNETVNSLFLAILIFFPPIYLNSFMFMSDFLFLFLLILSFNCFENYIKKNSFKNLIYLNIFVLLCFTQRQFGFFINFLIFIYIIFDFLYKKKIDKKLFLGLILNTSVCLIIYVLIKYNLNLNEPFKFNLFNPKQILFIAYNFFQVTSYIGLFCIPFVLIQKKEKF
jgi:4-amino-4-deoxy-L-arabinose transferase-like glycosyltransferase